MCGRKRMHGDAATGFEEAVRNTGCVATGLRGLRNRGEMQNASVTRSVVRSPGDANENGPHALNGGPIYSL